MKFKIKPFLLSQLKEGTELAEAASARTITDEKGKGANYGSLCDRVNYLETVLSQIKTEIHQFEQEKTVILTNWIEFAIILMHLIL